MSRHRGGFLRPQPQVPAPTYPEYEGLRELAEESVRRDGLFVDPAKLRMRQQMSRGGNWRVAVLGHEGSPTLVEMHMLLLADGQDIDPPLPQWFVDAVAAVDRLFNESQARMAAARKRRDETDQAAWDAALAACQVEVEVRRNGHSRVRYGLMHNLGHVVPKADVRSGPSRRHRAGRALCETEHRAKPLDLSGGSEGPATCESCLRYTPKVRLAAV